MAKDKPVQVERERLVESFRRSSSDSPTLCEGWDARDLLTHLINRELYPHHMLGTALTLSKSIDKKHELEDMPYDDLVEVFAEGRQKFSPLQVGKLDELMNTAEYFVHHEDLLRGGDVSQPRELSKEDQDAVYASLKRMSKVLFLKSPVGVDLVAPGYELIEAGTKSARATGIVTVKGDPLELLLFAFGREYKAHVEYSGKDAHIETLLDSKRGS